MAQQLIASPTSQALELAQAGAVMIFNHGPSAAHVVSGADNTVVATAATGSMIARGVAVRVGAAGGFIAAICDAGTATLDISPVAAASAGSADFLPLSGGTLSGNIAMGSHSITGLADPVDAQDAATKGYIDTALAPLLERITSLERRRG